MANCAIVLRAGLFKNEKYAFIQDHAICVIIDQTPISFPTIKYLMGKVCIRSCHKIKFNSSEFKTFGLKFLAQWKKSLNEFWRTTSRKPNESCKSSDKWVIYLSELFSSKSKRWRYKNTYVLVVQLLCVIDICRRWGYEHESEELLGLLELWAIGVERYFSFFLILLRQIWEVLWVLRQVQHTRCHHCPANLLVVFVERKRRPLIE